MRVKSCRAISLYHLGLTLNSRFFADLRDQYLLLQAFNILLSAKSNFSEKNPPAV